MIRAKNFETVTKFVKVLPRILWPLFSRTYDVQFLTFVEHYFILWCWFILFLRHWFSSFYLSACSLFARMCLSLSWVESWQIP